MSDEFTEAQSDIYRQDREREQDETKRQLEADREWDMQSRIIYDNSPNNPFK